MRAHLPKNSHAGLGRQALQIYSENAALTALNRVSQRITSDSCVAGVRLRPSSAADTGIETPKPEELAMTTTEVRGETAIETPRARTIDMKLEVVVIPVSDVDRAKEFYARLGWRVDAEFVGEDWRVIQFTPPGSGCSGIFW